MCVWWLSSEDGNSSEKNRLIAHIWAATYTSQNLVNKCPMKSQLYFPSIDSFLSLPNTLLHKNMYHWDKELAMVLWTHFVT